LDATFIIHFTNGVFSYDRRYSVYQSSSLVDLALIHLGGKTFKDVQTIFDFAYRFVLRAEQFKNKAIKFLSKIWLNFISKNIRK
jgi:hypothetical protein